MKTLTTPVFLLVMFCLTTAWGAIAARPDVDDVIGELALSYNKGRINDIAGLYTGNAVVMPPSSEILASRAAIKQYWNSLREAGFYKYTIYHVGIRIVGDTAYQTGLWEAVRKDSAGNYICLDGNISNVLSRQKDGTWKIKLQSWN